MSVETNIGLNSYKEKSTSIKIMVRSLELRLGGQTWGKDSNSFKYIGRPLCSTDIINKAVVLLQPFAEESNLITIKDFETWSRQKWEINSSFNETLLTNAGCQSSNYKVILKSFKTTLQNIGDIILGSKNLMKSILSTNEDELKNNSEVL